MVGGEGLWFKYLNVKAARALSFLQLQPGEKAKVSTETGIQRESGGTNIQQTRVKSSRSKLVGLNGHRLTTGDRPKGR